MKMKLFANDPIQAQKFEAMMAVARRQMWYRRLLWTRLKKMAPTKRRDLGDEWRAGYTNLLERAARHERRIARAQAVSLAWIFNSPETRQRKKLLQLASVDGKLL